MKIAFAVALLVQAQQALGRIVPPIDFSHPKIKDINADVFNQTIAKGIWYVFVNLNQFA
jgi:hypothetical protein